MSKYYYQFSTLALCVASTAAAGARASSGAAFVVAPANRISDRQRQQRHRQLDGSSSALLRAGNGDDDARGENNFYNDFDDFDPSSASSFGSGSSSEPSSSSMKSLTPAADDDDAPPPSSPSDPAFFQSLQKRREQLRRSSRELLERWTSGSVDTFAAVTVNEEFYRQQEEKNQNGPQLPFDWVRRIAIGSYPKVACGSAYGSVYVADVESKELLGIAHNVHSSHHNAESVDGLDERLKAYIYGEYDGGGVLAVAMHNNLVASSGREGGVKLFQLIGEGELKFVGDVPSLRRPLPGVTPTLVTCLKFDSMGRLFMGGADGLLRMAEFADDAQNMEVAVISSPKQLEYRQAPSSVLSLDVSEELDMVASAHANGNVCVYSTASHEEGESSTSSSGSTKTDCLLGVWNPFADTNNACHARSVAFVSGGEEQDQQQQQQTGDHDESKWSIVVGGGNGNLWMQEIHPSHKASLSNNEAPSTGSTTAQPLFKENTMQQIKPSHQGPVLSMASRPGGILVSTSHDGMLRMSQLWPVPKPLYGMGGYKAWIGNVCIDREGKRLLSDGRDDIVVVHDFSTGEEEEVTDL